LLALIISSAQLFAESHTARCANAFAQGEAARVESFALRGGVGAGKEFCVSLAIAQKENRVALAAQSTNKATIIVIDANAIEVFLNTKFSFQLISSQPPNFELYGTAPYKNRLPFTSTRSGKSS